MPGDQEEAASGAGHVFWSWCADGTGEGVNLRAFGRDGLYGHSSSGGTCLHTHPTLGKGSPALRGAPPKVLDKEATTAEGPAGRRLGAEGPGASLEEVGRRGTGGK